MRPQAPTAQPPSAPRLQGWTVLSLRPRGQHAGLRAAARRRGAHTLGLSPIAITTVADPATRATLAEALRADIVLFTSPNAVAAAAAIHPLRVGRGQVVLAVGSGTQRALRQLGIHAPAPGRMDSEGLLAMPQLATPAQRRVGLVTGCGGRNLLAPALRKRGAQVARADVYARTPVTLSAGALEKLRLALGGPHTVLVALSSGEALQQTLAQLPRDLRKPFANIAVAAASVRLAELARSHGFRRIAIAADARPGSLLQAAIDAFV